MFSWRELLYVILYVNLKQEAKDLLSISIVKEKHKLRIR
jgi:hypothetical protein